jgi:hypothetical protein
MQQFILADPIEFQADLQRKLDKMKSDIILEISQTFSEKKDDPKYLTRNEICERYRISLVTLHSLTTKLKIPSIKIGKRRLYESTEIEKFFNEK